MITQKELAAKLGVSYSTVSLALSGSPKVNPETLRQVQAAAAAAGYRPNLNARALQGHRSRLIGIVFPEFSHAYYGELSRDLHRLFRAAGYTAVAFTVSDHQDLRKLLDELCGRGVDGIVSGLHDPALQPLCRSRIGVVMYRAAGPLPCSSVDIDREAGGYTAGQHLIGLGYRHLAYLGSTHGGCEDRLLGFVRAVAEAGLELPAARIVDRGSGLAAGYAALQTLLRQGPPPRAVFAFNDSTALGAMRAAHEAGLRIPQDLAVVGFDDISEGRFAIPALTTVAQPREETARHLVELMLARLDAGRPDIRHVRLATRLIVRESCGSPRVAANPQQGISV